MRIHRLTTAPLAVLVAAAAVSPASAASADRLPGPPTWAENPRPVTEQVVVPQPPGPPTWPVDPQPIAPGPAAVDGGSEALDPVSIGIGAGVTATLAFAVLGGAGPRRRREQRPGAIRLS